MGHANPSCGRAAVSAEAGNRSSNLGPGTWAYPAPSLKHLRRSYLNPLVSTLFAKFVSIALFRVSRLYCIKEVYRID